MSVHYSLLLLMAAVVGGVVGVAIYAIRQMQRNTEATMNCVLDSAHRVLAKAGVTPGMVVQDNRPCAVETEEDRAIAEEKRWLDLEERAGKVT